MSPPDSDSRSEKSADAFRTITEVADLLDVQQHVLRFWETKFSQIKPMKRAGGRRYYRPEDVRLLDAIRVLLHEEGYTIRGVQKILRENGVKAVIDGAAAAAQPEATPATPRDPAPEEVVAVQRVAAAEEQSSSMSSEAQDSLLPGFAEPVKLDAGTAEQVSPSELGGAAYRQALVRLKAELIEIRALLPEGK